MNAILIPIGSADDVYPFIALGKADKFVNILESKRGDHLAALSHRINGID